MTKKTPGKIALLTQFFLPLLIVMAVFIAVMPWLTRQSHAAAQVLTIAFMVLTLGYSLFMGHRWTRRLDEVQKAQTAFAHSNGWIWGGFATMLLLTLHPVMNLLIDLVNAVVNVRGTGSLDMTNRRAVMVAFVMGGTLVMMMQALAIVVAAIVFQRRMAGSGERS
ncbi:MAG: hypothetical protein ACREUT_13600 [Steroidobacteraceae bacterium]